MLTFSSEKNRRKSQKNKMRNKSVVQQKDYPEIMLRSAQKTSN